jgi:sigma-B regulation protein RsbQ
MPVLQRHHVQISGEGPPLVFAHGFGCDQQMWRFVAPAFEATHRVVLFDHVGCGRSDLSAWSPERHATLDGYAEDLAGILDAADLHDATLVGHSVSAMITMLAARKRPGRVGRLAMVCPSPRYLDDPPAYRGGFAPADVDAMLEMIEGNMLGWAQYLAPVVMGLPAGDALTDELRASFCAIDPYITRRFATATFLSDNRADLPGVTHPTLVLQMREDAIAPVEVGRYVAERIPRSTYVELDGAGHCPHLTHPAATIAALRDFLAAPEVGPA